MNNYIVYRHTSPSSKVYIGITCQKSERRWRDGKGYKKCIVFYKAIQKYGWTNFKHEILYSGLNEISAKLIEEDLIYYYKSLNISYNIYDGGETKKLSEETKKKISERTREAMKDPEIRKRMSDNRKGKLIKSVSQYSLDGKLIKTYKSIKESSIENKIPSQNISECCRGLRKTAGGFIWKYEK